MYGIGTGFAESARARAAQEAADKQMEFTAGENALQRLASERQALNTNMTNIRLNEIRIAADAANTDKQIAARQEQAKEERKTRKLIQGTFGQRIEAEKEAATVQHDRRIQHMGFKNTLDIHLKNLELDKKSEQAERKRLTERYTNASTALEKWKNDNKEALARTPAVDFRSLPAIVRQFYLDPKIPNSLKGQFFGGNLKVDPKTKRLFMFSPLQRQTSISKTQTEMINELNSGKHDLEKFSYVERAKLAATALKNRGQPDTEANILKEMQSWKTKRDQYVAVVNSKMFEEQSPLANAKNKTLIQVKGTSGQPIVGQFVPVAKNDTARLYQTLPAFIPTLQAAEATLKNDQLQDPNALINYSKLLEFEDLHRKYADNPSIKKFLETNFFKTNNYEKIYKALVNKNDQSISVQIPIYDDTAGTSRVIVQKADKAFPALTHLIEGRTGSSDSLTNHSNDDAYLAKLIGMTESNFTALRKNGHIKVEIVDANAMIDEGYSKIPSVGETNKNRERVLQITHPIHKLPMEKINNPNANIALDLIVTEIDKDGVDQTQNPQTSAPSVANAIKLVATQKYDPKKFEVKPELQKRYVSLKALGQFGDFEKALHAYTGAIDKGQTINTLGLYKDLVNSLDNLYPNQFKTKTDEEKTQIINEAIINFTKIKNKPPTTITADRSGEQIAVQHPLVTRSFKNFSEAEKSLNKSAVELGSKVVDMRTMTATYNNAVLTLGAIEASPNSAHLADFLSLIDVKLGNLSKAEKEQAFKNSDIRSESEFNNIMNTLSQGGFQQISSGVTGPPKMLQKVFSFLRGLAKIPNFVGFQIDESKSYRRGLDPKILSESGTARSQFLASRLVEAERLYSERANRNQAAFNTALDNAENTSNIEAKHKYYREAMKYYQYGILDNISISMTFLYAGMMQGDVGGRAISNQDFDVIFQALWAKGQGGEQARGSFKVLQQTLNRIDSRIRSTKKYLGVGNEETSQNLIKVSTHLIRDSERFINPPSESGERFLAGTPLANLGSENRSESLLVPNNIGSSDNTQGFVFKQGTSNRAGVYAPPDRTFRRAFDSFIRESLDESGLSEIDKVSTSGSLTRKDRLNIIKFYNAFIGKLERSNKYTKNSLQMLRVGGTISENNPRVEKPISDWMRIFIENHTEEGLVIKQPTEDYKTLNNTPAIANALLNWTIRLLNAKRERQ